MSSDNRPPRWLNCPCYSDLIADTFIAFKTPLSARYQVPDICRFTPEMFISRMKSTHRKALGLWISLTFTERYYDKETVQDEANNIKYFHIECRGHDGAPSIDETRRFITLCRTFLRQNPNKLIGVHCTHGFNRTGFMICSYLCECDQFAIDAAISVFASKRQPGIYKQEYINELIRRYGDPDDPEDDIRAPERPAWCHEDLSGDMGIADPDLIDDDGLLGPSSCPGGEGGAAEQESTTNSQFMDGLVLGVQLVTNRNVIDRVFAKAARMCHWDLSTQRVKFPGCQPVSMTQNNIALLIQHRYMVSWKADGSRFMMLIEDADRIYFLTRKHQVFQIDGLIFPQRDNLDAHITDTLIDGEMVIDKDGDQEIPRYLIYDIIAYRNNTMDFGEKHFEHRYKCIQDFVVGPRDKAKQLGKIDRTREPFGVRKKKFFELAQTKDVLRMKLSHQIDGLIFQPCREGYVAGTCERVLKWKPPELNSIDLKLNIRESQERGMLPQRTGLLTTCNQRPGSYFKKIKYTRDLEQYDGKIVECAWDFQAQSWKILRERADKFTANTFETATSVLHSIIYPVRERDLLEYIYNKVLRNNPNYPTYGAPGRPHQVNSSSGSNNNVNSNNSTNPNITSALIRSNNNSNSSNNNNNNNIRSNADQ